MRAYQMWDHGPWIDLDHVLGVDPPKFVDRMGSGGFFVEMNVHLAFQDKPRRFSRYQEQELDNEYELPRPECNKIGWPSELYWSVNYVYRPLIKIWSGREFAMGEPIDYGYDAKRYYKRRGPHHATEATSE